MCDLIQKKEMKISGRVVSRKAISLSRAAKLISRFAAVENGSSPAVSIYLHRTSDAFNHLLQFHSKAKNLNTTIHTDNNNKKKNKKRKKIDED